MQAADLDAIAATVPPAPPVALSWALCVATLNRIDILELCVNHALAQTRLPKEIVIVDASDGWQAHGDRIQALVRPTGIALTYLPAPKRSVPAQRNRAIGAATADILFLIDDDSLMYPDCAEAILRVYEADTAQRIAAVSATDAPSQSEVVSDMAAKPGASRSKSAGRVLSVSALTRFLWREVLMMSADRVFIPYDGRFHLPKGRDKEDLTAAGLYAIPMISGYRLTVRRQVAQSEPFDADLLAYASAEDLDATYRFSRHGFNVATADARLYHHEVAAGRLKRRQAIALSVMNVAFLLRKHSRHPFRDIPLFYLMVLRRIVAELLKDLLSRRWTLPQLRGVVWAAVLSVGVFWHDRQSLASFYDGLQRRVLKLPPAVAP